MALIQAPQTYAQWMNVLDVLRAGKDDEAVLNAMKSGTLLWQTGVAERFSRQLIDTVSVRLNTAVDKFQKDMTRSQGQERVLIQSMSVLKRELSYLAQVMNIPALPEPERSRHVALVRNEANRIQASLEDSAKGDRTGRLASIVRNHKVNVF